jgi:hypothetical protein
MKRVTIIACARTGTALAALACFLSTAPDALPDVSADLLSRSTGLAVLGIALVAAGLAFRAAMRTEPNPVSAPVRPHASEYRRGFKGRVARAQLHRPEASQRGVVVALRRAVAEQGKAAAAVETGATLPVREIEQLQDMLRNRISKAVARNADMAKRTLSRGDADPHGLAPQ